jgi:predicted alpha/beta-fold hydrolase
VYKDGGTITLDWAYATDSNKTADPSKDQKPIIIMAPGINNDSNEIYMINFVRTATAQGYHCVCIGARGQQGVGKFTSYLFVTPGRDGDIREVVDSVHK